MSVMVIVGDFVCVCVCLRVCVLVLAPYCVPNESCWQSEDIVVSSHNFKSLLANKWFVAT